jgi:F0F1-type ATP synthase membrane subunit a
MPALKSITRSALFLASGAALFAEGGHERAASLSDTLNLPITNSILTSWVVTIAIIIGVRMLVGTPKTIPGRGQSIVESALEALRDLYGPIVGKKAMPAAFPLLVTLFVFIVLHNWSSSLKSTGQYHQRVRSPRRRHRRRSHRPSRPPKRSAAILAASGKVLVQAIIGMALAEGLGILALFLATK